MTELFTSKVFSITITLCVFYFAQKMYARWKYALLNPVLLSILALIAFLKLTHVSYADYFEGGQIISFFLGPAVVALGVPLYLQLPEIKKRGKAILLAVLLGSAGGILDKHKRQQLEINLADQHRVRRVGRVHITFNVQARRVILT